MTARLAGQSFLAGVLAGVAIMAGYAVRTAYTIIKDHRVGDAFRFFDFGGKHVH